MSTPRERREIYGTPRWRSLRAEVLAAANRRCELCAQPGADVADHRTPIRAGGDPWAKSNLRCLCRRCHHAETFGRRATRPRAWVEWDRRWKARIR